MGDGSVQEWYSDGSSKRWWIDTQQPYTGPRAVTALRNQDMGDGSVTEWYSDGTTKRWWIDSGAVWKGKDWQGNRLAEGGITTGPTTALIGEAGPEAIIPLKELPGIVRSLTQSETNGQLGGFFSGRSTQSAQAVATGSSEYGPEAGQGIAPRRGGSAGGDIIINTTINLQGADFSDPTFINRLSRQVGDAIVEKVRIAGSGRVA